MEAGFGISQNEEGMMMMGIIILGSGIGLIILAGIFLMLSVVYRKTAGKKILEELKSEYE